MKITIQSNYDFTPKGKRRAQIVTLRGMFGKVKRIRWYVSGRIFNQLPVTEENLKLSKEWSDNTQNLLPQNWEDFAFK